MVLAGIIPVSTFVVHTGMWACACVHMRIRVNYGNTPHFLHMHDIVHVGARM